MTGLFEERKNLQNVKLLDLHKNNFLILDIPTVYLKLRGDFYPCLPDFFHFF